MKEFYKHNPNDNQLSNKLQNHEFELMPGAWEDMARQLDQLDKPPATGAAAWSGWYMVFIGALLVTGASAVGLYWYNAAPTAQQTAMMEQDQPQTVLVQNTTQQEINANAFVPSSANNSQDILTASANAKQPVVEQYNKVKSSNLEQPKKMEDNAGKLPPKMPENSTIISKEPTSNQQFTGIADPKQDLEFNGSKSGALNETNQTQQDYERYIPKVLNIETILHNKALEFSEEQSGELADLGFELPRYGADWKSSWEAGLELGVAVKGYDARQDSLAHGQISTPVVAGGFVRKNMGRHALEVGLNYKAVQRRNKYFNYQSADAAIYIPNEGSMVAAEAAMPVVSYDLKRLHLLELPIRYKYALHPKHRISVGARLGYLIAASSNYKRNHPTSEIGFKPVDVSMLAGYEYAFSDHMAVAIQYNLGLINLAGNSVNQPITSMMSEGGAEQAYIIEVVDQRQQNVVRSPNRWRNSDFQLALKYTF